MDVSELVIATFYYQIEVFIVFFCTKCKWFFVDWEIMRLKRVAIAIFTKTFLSVVK